ncbi:hypothetical protein HPB51_008600 [Rhipicephalus microplus]|uniref:Importin N-terminal domain-containing protein n=1 Tax=Rhipicephalus microplus TaxID=6941 RepID=A0A9J6ENP1_RHIMP|nr:hypothetical protein HPB51_008600 [Rhipicephalus microplus]
MSYNLQTVEAALSQLYSNMGAGSAEANQYLTAMQASAQAWDIAWKLLDKTKPVEVQYFGATTLHTKISRHWYQLPQREYESLRNRLLQAMVDYALGPRLVLTKILVALQSTEQLMRGPSRKLLEESGGKIVAFINRLAVLNTDALGCLSSWSQLAFVPEQHLVLLPRVLACVRNAEFCRPAVELLTVIAGQPDLHKFPRFVMEVIRCVVQLDDVFSEKMASGDTELCGHLCRLLVEIVECHAHSMVLMLLSKTDHKPTILKLFDHLLKFTGTPHQYPVEETWSRDSLPAWHALQDSVTTCEGPQRESLLLMLQPLWHNLFVTLLRKAQLPSDQSQWDSEEKDALRCYRQDIGDCIMALFDVLRESLLAALAVHLELAVRALEKDRSAWQAAEVCLLALQSVAENVRPQDEPYLGPQLRKALPHLMADPRLQPATLTCLGSLGSWLQDPQQLGLVLPVLLAGLEAGPKMSMAASLALKDLARDCRQALVPHTQPLLEAIQRLLLTQQLRPAERLLASWELAPSEAWLSTVLDYQLQLLQAGTPAVRQALQELAALVSGLAGREEPPSLVEAVVQRALPALGAIAAMHASDEGTIEALCECVKRAAVALERPAAEQLLFLLVQLQEACPQASVVTRSTAVVPTPAPASVVDTCRPLLLMLSIPSNRLHPSAVPALARICNVTLIPAMASLANFQERTAVLESLYQCLGFLARKAVYVLTPEAVNLSMVFQCAILAIGLPEKGTVKAAAFFLAEVIQQSVQHDTLVQLAEVVDTYRMLILERCFLVVGGGQSPRSAVEPMADVVLALTKQNLQATSHCVSELLLRPGFPSPQLTHDHRVRYIRLLLKERTNKRIIKEALVEMCLVCRGIVGTEYAAQTTQHFP